MNDFYKAALKIQSALNGFDPRSSGPQRTFQQSELYPIFIVGAPRSGSTLLYQLLLKHARLTYISNLMSLVPNRMILIAKWTRYFNRFNKIKKSDLGYLPGLFSPSEAGAIQRMWFGEGSQTESYAYIRNTIIRLTDIAGLPFINKNLMNSMRMIRIHKILPEVKFIFIRRDPLYNAQSLLLSRKKVHGSINHWWSVKPEGYVEAMKSVPEYQVVWQVREIEKTISAFFTEYGSQHVDVSYEDLCISPEKTIKGIVNELKMELKEGVGFDDLTIENSKRVTKVQWDEMNCWYKKLY